MHTSGWRSLADGSRVWLRLALLVALVLSALPAAAAGGPNIIVGTGGYPCNEDGLRAAILLAILSGNTVEFVNCRTINIVNVIQLTKIVVMTSNDGLTTINANGIGRVFDISPGAWVILKYLAIEGGYAGGGDGGNIYNGGTLSCEHCTISNGQAANGAGIANGPGAVLDIASSTVSGNHAALNGGGISNAATAEVNDQGYNTFTDNSAGNDGGGTYSAGLLSLTSGTVFNANVAGYAGGGVALQGGILDITPYGPATGGNRLPAIAASLAAGPDLAAATAATSAVSPTLFISNSAGLGGGGAIFNTGHLTLSNVEILSNTTSLSGGGIESYTGTVQISNALLAYNRAGANYGGGAIENGWTLTATAMAVISNTGGNQGGGFDTYHGTVVISDSTFMSNTAALGGGINVNSGNLLLDSSTVADNVVSNAGGGLYQSGTTTIVNSTFSANAATGLGGGGGINNNGTLTITSSSLVSNSAPSETGNLANFGGAWLHNTLIAFGDSPNCSGVITSTGYNLDSVNTCHLHASGDLTNTVPLIGPLADNGGGLAGVGGTGLPFDGQAPLTHALLGGSPAIDTGDPAHCPATDERGAARPVNICDKGAYEFGAKIAQTISFTLPALIALYQSPYALGGAASSGLVVSYTVSGSACSLAGSSLLLNSLGVCGVTAHQAGNVNYNPAADVPLTTTVGLAVFLPLVTR